MRGFTAPVTSAPQHADLTDSPTIFDLFPLGTATWYVSGPAAGTETCEFLTLSLLLPQWKRLKRGKGAPPSDVVARTSTTGSHGEQPASPSTESCPDTSQHAPLPDRTLILSVDTSSSLAGPSSRPSLRSRLSVAHQRQPSQGRKDDPLGLTVLHNPPERTLDVLFIHGLGGSSLRTWCHGRDLENLWPKLWLPEELPTARILTFGYNAYFSSREAKTSCTIGDFATDLLFRMRHSESTQTTERLGQVPIVVVAHSMGGLVFKKAFVQGQSNVEFTELISMIKAVVFLATPHRGSDLAETLNRALSSSLFGHSPKQYVAELARGSPTIDELNDSFRHHTSKLQLFSFYETLATVTGPVSVMVVEKSSAVMGYPSETPAPLAANHHDVCKFTSKQDPNYAMVVGALRGAAGGIVSSTAVVDEASPEDLEQLTKMLGVTGAPEEDLDAGRAARQEGTCEGFLDTQEADSWLHETSPGILWVHAGPGCGKSIVSSFVIEQLFAAGHCCAYFYFKFGQRDKQSAASMILSIAYQMALQAPEFRQQMVEIAKAGTKLSGMDAGIAWDKLFSRTLARTKGPGTLYWVLDGLDEADSSRRVVDLLARVGGFRWPVRVLVLGRPLPNIKREFELARKKVQVVDMPLPGTQDDIRLMVTEEVNSLIASDDFKAEVVSTITTRAQGSFLWASLVTEKVIQCHREDQVRRVLASTPDGMQRLYDRMTDAVLGVQLDEDKELARLLLIWAMYAVTPVTVDELAEAYPAEFSPIMDANHTIAVVCGQFVSVNPQGSVTLVHHSAREHLRKEHTPFSLNPEHANEELLEKCLAALGAMVPGDGCSDSDVSRHLCYAAISWPLHLERSNPSSDRVLDALARFFRAPCSMVWIQILAGRGRLSELLGASRRLEAYLGQRRRAKPSDSSQDLPLLDLWVVDLLKVPVKFAYHLSERPSAIYEHIPALSPQSSALHQLFGEAPTTSISVDGLCVDHWDDRVARISKGASTFTEMAVSQRYLAMATESASAQSSSSVILWDTTLFVEQKVLTVGDDVKALVFNDSETLLAACSSSRTWVWRMADWSPHVVTQNPWELRMLQFKFDPDDDLVVVEQSGHRYKLPTRCANPTAAWELQVSRVFDPETTSDFVGLALNQDCTLAALTFNYNHVSIWAVDPPRMIATLTREFPIHKRDTQGRSAFRHGAIAWHPSDSAVICHIGYVFKWSFRDNTYHEIESATETKPMGVVVSRDGRRFATLDRASMLTWQVYDVASMRLIWSLDFFGIPVGIDLGLDGHRVYMLFLWHCDVWEPISALQPLGPAEGPTVAQGLDLPSSAAEATPRGTAVLTRSPKIQRQEMAIIEPTPTSERLLVWQRGVEGLAAYDPKSRRTFNILDLEMNIGFFCFAWNPEHGRLAYSTQKGGVTVLSVCIAGENSGLGPVCSESLLRHQEFHFPSQDVAWGLLFDRAGNRLLISGKESLQVVSCPSGTVLAQVDCESLNYGVGLSQYHFQDEYLVRFSATSVTVFSWGVLEKMASAQVELQCSPSGAERDKITEAEFDGIPNSHSTRYTLLRARIKSPSPGRSFAVYLLPAPEVLFGGLNPIACVTSPGGGKPLLRIAPLPLSDSAWAIGILPDDRIVIVDSSFWVWSMPIPSLLPHIEGAELALATVVGARRHFFFSHDWVTYHDLWRCRLLSDGTVLCPVGGMAVIMKGDLMAEGCED